MSSILENVQPAVKKETKRVVVYHSGGTDPDVDFVCSPSF